MRARLRMIIGLSAVLGLVLFSLAGPAMAQDTGTSPGPRVGGILLTNNNPAPGETFGACAPAGTFAPGSQVRIVLGGQDMGTVTADAQGAVCAEIEIPCDFPTGPMRLDFVGIGPNGQPVTVSADVTVAAETCPAAGAAGREGGALPRTGSASTTPLTAAGVGLVLIGAFAVAAARRRRAAQAIES